MTHHKINLSMIKAASTLFEKGELENCLLIGVQHCLYTTFKMMEALFDKGLAAENILLLGKCYSTDPSVFQMMREKKIDISEDSLKFDSHIAYDDYFDQKIKEFLQSKLQKIMSKNYRKIIILDDGGALIRKFQTFSCSLKNVIAIEQTSSGYNDLLHANHQIPIINVARSKAKHIFEPKQINLQAIENIQKAILHLNRPDPKKILVLGNGSIGSALKSLLENKYQVDLYDIQASKNRLAIHNLNKLLPDYDMILGCSGKCSIGHKQHHLLKKDCILASISSSDREFDAVYLRRTKPRQTMNCFNDIYSHRVFLLNSGFPMTFVGKNAEILNYSHFTRALLMCAIKQSLKEHKKSGFIQLDETLQNNMLNVFKNLESS
ncbi:MAG: Adenosylhomocysteinase [Chlamydiae bacterium]|nr:Adenosylhomocysteinase [Chlamydiota bacterium]